MLAYTVYVRGDVNLFAMPTQKSHKHWSPTNNDDSAVHHKFRLSEKIQIYYFFKYTQ